MDEDPNLDLVFANDSVPDQKCFGDGNFNFNCGDVSPDTNRTMGVALGEVRRLLFSDGFESGDLSAWSN